MTNKSLFRRVYESMMEGRRREAQRHIDQYLQDRGVERPRKD